MPFDGFDGDELHCKDLTVRTTATVAALNLTGKVVQTAPVRGTDSYEYGVLFDLDETFFVGGAATKSYGLQVSGERPSGSAATGDSNDALVRVSGNNYAANDANFVWRGVNASIANRSGGVAGRMDHNLGVQNKSGGTVTTLIGTMVTAENYGTMGSSGTFGGVDVLLKNEAAVATTEFGLRLRNENNSIAGPVASAILVTDTGANTGWNYLIDASGASTLLGALKLPDDTVVADAGGGTMGSIVSGAWIKVVVGSTTFKIPLYANA